MVCIPARSLPNLVVFSTDYVYVKCEDTFKQGNVPIPVHIFILHNYMRCIGHMIANMNSRLKYIIIIICLSHT